MSPEQIDGVDLDERADLFCLGVVMYQMVTGRHPFLRDTMAATIFATCNNDFTPLRDVNDAVPPAFDWAVRRCLAADRDKRIRSADELLDMLAKTGESGARPAVLRPTADPARAFFDKYKRSVLKFVSRNAPGVKRAVRESVDSLGNQAEAVLSKTPLSRYVKGRPARAAALTAGSILVALSIALALLVLAAAVAPSLPPSDSLQSRLITACTKALSENDRHLAHNTLDGFATIRPLHPLAKVLIARVDIRDGLYGPAKSVLLDVESTPGGRTVLKKQLPPVLDDIRKQLISGPASPELLDIVRFVLLAGRHAIVRSWVKSSSFWLRWNAVDILQASGVDVDMASVYILDLNGRELMQAKIEAVKQLGKIGSRRAKDALREAAGRTQTDPLVAQEARRVLEENRY
jgi:hypothetical protein